MKKLLIISPHFPPTNAADMHRVRQSLWYFETLGWMPTVICVNEKYVETSQDPLLCHTIPSNLLVFKTRAFSTNWTKKIALGSLALRSLFFFFFKGNKLLHSQKFDLVFFSTTQFPVLILGRYWHWRFGVPYIIDMQDPWHSDFYQNKPKSEQPSKYWFSYRLNKFLEPIAMKSVSGIISVSQGYCDILQSRYANINPQNCTVIPFGAFEKDFEIAAGLEYKAKTNIQKSKINILYIGRGGADMATSLQIIFKAFKIGLEKNNLLFSGVHITFCGTSYAKAGSGTKTIAPLAEKLGLSAFVTETTNRIPYFESLQKLMEADILIIPGSSDPNYTASKIYPYILAKKPILAIFSKTSSVIEVLKCTHAGEFITFDIDNIDVEDSAKNLLTKWEAMLIKLPYTPDTNWEAFRPFTALEMTKKQVAFFDEILKKN
ncbi:MAG: glycosyltransferase [Cytophagales bacterium]